MPDQDIAEAGRDFPVSPPAGVGIVPKKITLLPVQLRLKIYETDIKSGCNGAILHGIILKIS